MSETAKKPVGTRVQNLDAFQPLTRSTLHEGVYEQICAALMDGRLRPGQRISLRKLAAAMNTSPMPVREAVRRLEASHVLEIRPGNVLAVPMPTDEQLVEIRDIRVSLEGLAAELAVANISSRAIERVAHLAKEMKAPNQQHDLVSFLAMNREFHFTIYEAAGRPILTSIIKSLWLRVAPFFFEICRSRGHVEFSIEQHDRAVAALEKKDSRGARDAIVNDIMGAAERIHVYLSARPLVENTEPLFGGPRHKAN
jgi:DNA-binding GntR family transcriptional regulator